MIGAKAVSELAREMELACRSRDAALVLAGHDRFLREYADLADGLRSVMQTSG
jgi:HPt (histidine-containing phosphotransfer) domain-containing protein